MRKLFATIVLLISTPCFAEANYYLICYGEDEMGATHWDWAEFFSESYLRLPGRFSDTNHFIVQSFDEEDLTRICKRSVDRLSTRLNSSLQFTHFAAGRFSWWKDYEIQFQENVERKKSRKKKSGELRPKDVIDILSADERVEEEGSQAGIYGDDIIPIAQSLHAYISAHIQFIGRMANLAKVECEDPSLSFPEQLICSVNNSTSMVHKERIEKYLESIQYNARTGRYLKRLNSGYNLLVKIEFTNLSTHFLYKKVQNQALLYKLNRIMSISDQKKRRSEFLGYLQGQVLDVFRKRQRFDDLEKKLNSFKYYQVDQSYLLSIFEHNLYLGYAHAKAYLEILGDQAHLKKLRRDYPDLFPEDLVEKVRARYEYPLYSPQQEESSSSGELSVGVEIENTEEELPVESLPEREARKQALKLARVQRQENDVVRNDILENEIQVGEPLEETPTFKLDKKSRAILEALSSPAYVNTVSVHDFQKLFAALIKQNDDLFEKAEIQNPNGVEMTFGFKRYGQGMLFYTLHRPHRKGKGKSDVVRIPAPYRQEYYHLFELIGATPDKIQVLGR